MNPFHSILAQLCRRSRAFRRTQEVSGKTSKNRFFRGVCDFFFLFVSLTIRALLLPRSCWVVWCFFSVVGRSFTHLSPSGSLFLKIWNRVVYSLHSHNRSCARRRYHVCRIMSTFFFFFLEQRMCSHSGRTMVIDVLHFSQRCSHRPCFKKYFQVLLRRMFPCLLVFQRARGFSQRAFRHRVRSRRIQELETSVHTWERQLSFLFDI